MSKTDIRGAGITEPHRSEDEKPKIFGKAPRPSCCATRRASDSVGVN